MGGRSGPGKSASAPGARHRIGSRTGGGRETAQRRGTKAPATGQAGGHKGGPVAPKDADLAPRRALATSRGSGPKHHQHRSHDRPPETLSRTRDDATPATPTRPDPRAGLFSSSRGTESTFAQGRPPSEKPSAARRGDDTQQAARPVSVPRERIEDATRAFSHPVETRAAGSGPAAAGRGKHGGRGPGARGGSRIGEGHANEDASWATSAGAQPHVNPPPRGAPSEPPSVQSIPGSRDPEGSAPRRERPDPCPATPPPAATRDGSGRADSRSRGTGRRGARGRPPSPSGDTHTREAAAARALATRTRESPAHAPDAGQAQRDPPPTRRGEAQAAVGKERRSAPPRGRRSDPSFAKEEALPNAQR
uniref:Serine/arginine repetitive matrix protein 1-like n=1 Tax=Callorhinus ursinus TaxID=34884 RepID=A0A3Q7NIT1_CALUR|nr:serine/arginine repetitive matrix protein 1-like [Callorhinus ursinus]